MDRCSSRPRGRGDKWRCSSPRRGRCRRRTARCPRGNRSRTRSRSPHRVPNRVERSTRRKGRRRGACMRPRLRGSDGEADDLPFSGLPSWLCPRLRCGGTVRTWSRTLTTDRRLGCGNAIDANDVVGEAIARIERAVAERGEDDALHRRGAAHAGGDNLRLFRDSPNHGPIGPVEIRRVCSELGRNEALDKIGFPAIRASLNATDGG